MIRVMSRNNLIPLEQYMDFFRGRTFRQTLLVKAARTARIERQLVPHRVHGLHVSGRMTSTDKADGTFLFSSPTGATPDHAPSRRSPSHEKTSGCLPAPALSPSWLPKGALVQLLIWRVRSSKSCSKQLSSALSMCRRSPYGPKRLAPGPEPGSYRVSTRCRAAAGLPARITAPCR